MKKTKKIITAILMIIVGCVSLCGKTVKAESIYSYDANTKLYTEKELTKGAKQMTKGTKNGVYQVAKIKGNKIILRGGAGYHSSVDPYFKTSKKTYKLAKKCKFYYTDVSFQHADTDISEGPLYKRLSKKDVKTIMTDKYSKAKKEKIYDYEKNGFLQKKYYTSGFFGQVYVKNGKIVAILMNGGD